MNNRHLLSLFLGMLLALPVYGQFYVTGDEPAGLKWVQIETQNYKLIYPEGLDSLARVYASHLEGFRTQVGLSTAFFPNEKYRRKMPVILHATSSLANGQVTWAPRRMDLYTVQDPSRPLATPWVRDLVIHESRHVAQMQVGHASSHRLFSLLFGEMWTGAMAAVFGGPAFLEGDAVVAETALSRSGRGRAADFLEYYRVAFDDHDFRNWYQWRYSSLKKYTPDYYKLGYLTVAGIRALYDDPLFTQRFYNNVFRHKLWPFPMGNLRKTMREASGKSFSETFSEIQDYFHYQWDLYASQRQPSVWMDRVTPAGRRFEEYRKTALAGDQILSVRSGIARNTELVNLSKGGAHVAYFASETSDLKWSAPLGRLLWSEVIRHPRWTLQQSSRIVSLNLATGRKEYLNTSGRYFNPSPSPTDLTLSVTSYPMEGGSALLLLDGRNGEVLRSLPAPDSLQVVESAWLGDRLYASAISEAGFGLYDALAGYACLLPPQPVKIHSLRSGDERILFISDRNGIDELYGFAPADRSLVQYTNTRYGVSDAFFQGDSLYFSYLKADGRMLYRTAIQDLDVQTVSFDEIHPDPIAEILSAQEAALAASAPAPTPVVTSQPKRYHKFLHPGRIHSWAPVYFDSDAIQDLSFDVQNLRGLLGATLFYQNDLGTSSGSLGYSYDEAGHHNGYLKHTFHGALPVIETRLHLSDKPATHYVQRMVRSPRFYTQSISATKGPSFTFDGTVTAYIPFLFSRGGWITGIVPQLKWRFSNDVMDKSEYVQRHERSFLSNATAHYSLMGYTKGSAYWLQSLAATLRAYRVLPVTEAGVYPRLGIGLEAGYNTRLGFADLFSPNAFVYAYGYLPGFVPEHGWKLSVMAQKRFTENARFQETYANILPRGLAGESQIILQNYGAFTEQMKVTADYAMAIAPVDWTFLCPIAYIRNFVLTPHGDFTFFASHKEKANPGALISAGADLYARLENFIWIPYETHIGVSYSYNFGPGFNTLTQKGTALPHHYASLIFSIDL